VPMAAGLLLLAVFCAVELNRRAPLIEMRVFRDAAFSASMALNFLIGLSLFGSVLLVPLFLQQVQGYGAFDAGVVLGGQGLGAALTAPIGGFLTDRFGARKVVPAGLALLTGASIWMATLAPNTSRLVIALMLVTRGAGMGLSMMPSTAAAYITMPHALISRATATANVIMRVASGFGVAILATVLTIRIQAHLPHLPPGASIGTGGGLAAAHLPPALKAMLMAEATRGFQDTFLVTAALTLVCFPMALLLRRAPRVQR
jgi:MFS family permease